MNLLVFLIILFSVLLLAIVLALIFSQKFRQDIIGAPGKANILGILTVEGVVVVILCALFVGGLIYVISEFRQSIVPTPQDHMIPTQELPESLQSGDPNKVLEKIKKLAENEQNPPDNIILKKLSELTYDSQLSKEIREMRTNKEGPWSQTAKVLTIGIPQKESQPERGYAYVCSGSNYANSSIRLSNALSEDFGEKINLNVKGGGIDELDCASSKKIPNFLLNCLDAKELFSDVFIECTTDGEPRYKQRYYEELKGLEIPDDSPKIYLPVWVMVQDS